MAKEISGILVLNEYSTDNGVNWKTIVCEDTSQISHTASSSEKKTKCGTFTTTSLNAVAITGSGVAGGNLDADQASYLDIAALVKNLTTVEFRRRNAADAPNSIAIGEITNFQGSGRFTEATETSSTEDSTAFNWAFASSGDYELTSES
jgi:hypothetical protein